MISIGIFLLLVSFSKCECRGMVIPLYRDPTPLDATGNCRDQSYLKVARMASLFSVYLIIRPSDEPSRLPPPVLLSYKACVRMLKSKGVRVLAAIETRGPSKMSTFQPKPTNEIIAVMESYKSLSQSLDGFMLNDVPNITTDSAAIPPESILPFYSLLSQQVLKTGRSDKMVFFNSNGPIHPNLLKNKGPRVKAIVFNGGYNEWITITNCPINPSSPWCPNSSKGSLPIDFFDSLRVSIKSEQLAILIHSAPDNFETRKTLFDSVDRNKIGNAYVTAMSDWSELASEQLLALKART
jgi:hypothetical protein